MLWLANAILALPIPAGGSAVAAVEAAGIAVDVVDRTNAAGVAAVNGVAMSAARTAPPDSSPT